MAVLDLEDVSLPATTAFRLRAQLDCLESLLDGTESGALDRRPVPDKWSGRENLAHLARYQEMFLRRIERIRHRRPAASASLSG